MSSLPHSSGVYAIICLVSGRVYIGSSRDIAYRFRKHRTLLRAGKHHSIAFQRAWNKYGEAAFMPEVLELADESELLEREQEWLDVFEASNNKFTYNSSHIATAPMKGRKHSEQTRKMYLETRKGEQNGRYKPAARVCQTCGVKYKSCDKNAKYCSRACYNRAPKTEETYEKHRNSNKVWTYLVTDPDGAQHVVAELSEFCREHGLSRASMSRVASGRRKAYKSWLCNKIEVP